MQEMAQNDRLVFIYLRTRQNWIDGFGLSRILIWGLDMRCEFLGFRCKIRLTSDQTDMASSRRSDSQVDSIPLDFMVI